jgi:hypothetical protein
LIFLPSLNQTISNNPPFNKLLEIEKKIAASEGKNGELKANITKAIAN